MTAKSALVLSLFFILRYFFYHLSNICQSLPASSNYIRRDYIPKRLVQMAMVTETCCKTLFFQLEKVSVWQFIPATIMYLRIWKIYQH